MPPSRQVLSIWKQLFSSLGWSWIQFPRWWHHLPCSPSTTPSPASRFDLPGPIEIRNVAGEVILVCTLSLYNLYSTPIITHYQIDVYPVLVDMRMPLTLQQEMTACRSGTNGWNMKIRTSGEVRGGVSRAWTIYWALGMWRGPTGDTCLSISNADKTKTDATWLCCFLQWWQLQYARYFAK